MNKKILMTAGAMLAVVAGVAAFSAYEAHVINVTAHIENSLYVHPDEIAFGTVFPQEYIERQFTVAMSDSFQTAGRVDDIEYVIKQKPKCECGLWVDEATSIEDCPEGQYAPVDYATHECPDDYAAMESLCPFLSKVDGDPDDENDISHPSYYDDNDTPADKSDDTCATPTRYTSSDLNYSATGWAGWSCPAGTHAVGGGVIENTYPMGAEGIAEFGAPTIGGSNYPDYPHWCFNYGTAGCGGNPAAYNYPGGEEGYVAQNGGTAQTCKIYVDCLANNPDATGVLWKHDPEDLSDLWIVDLKVPPVDGFVGQDWPAGCPTVPTNDIDYGCDLWIEVTGISEAPPVCGDGVVEFPEECETAADCAVQPAICGVQCNCITGSPGGPI